MLSEAVAGWALIVCCSDWAVKHLLLRAKVRRYIMCFVLLGSNIRRWVSRVGAFRSSGRTVRWRVVKVRCQFRILTWGNTCLRCRLCKDRIFCCCSRVNLHSRRTVDPRMRSRPGKSHRLLFFGPPLDWGPSSSNAACNDTRHCGGWAENRIRACSRPSLCFFRSGWRSCQRVYDSLLSIRGLW